MGTSGSRDHVTGGVWTSANRAVGSITSSNAPSEENTDRALRNFVAASTASSPRSVTAPRKVATNIVGFISSVSQKGLEQTLRDYGLEHLIGKSFNEIYDAIIDYLGGESNTINQVDSRVALSDTWDELLGEAESAEELEELLKEQIEPEKLKVFLIKFFGNYIFAEFDNNYHEIFQEKFDEERLESELAFMKEYIHSLLEEKFNYEEDITNIDWNGVEGKKIIKEIQEKTYEVFKK